MTTQTEGMKGFADDVAGRTEDAVGGGDVWHQGKQALKSAEEMPPSVYLAAVAGSILLSAFLFLSGKKNLGQFVGLWAPTILNLALFTKQLRPSRDMS